MSSDNIAIQIDGLGKCYQIYDRPRDRLKQSIVPRFQALCGQIPSRYFREFWALKDVSFNVRRGETVGIIGRNGSGKSTLLQVICDTLAPTTGIVKTQGRVAALLELGAGFNPDFTGRENVFMNGIVLGFTQNEIEARFDDIAAFADIGDFIEQPVKHYSSGMYARLAFAVAISVDPDILVVDEALAVGDEPFQRKCFSRMEKIKSGGGTILLVSHSAHAIVDLCDRAVLIHNGQRLYTGSPKKTVGWYQKLMNADSDQSIEICNEIREDENETAQVILTYKEEKDNRSKKNHDQTPLQHAERNEQTAESEPNSESAEGYDSSLLSKSMVVYEPNGAEISKQRLVNLKGSQVNCILNGSQYELSFDISFHKNCQGVRFFTAMKTISGVMLGTGVYPKINEAGLNYRAGDIVRVFYKFTCVLNSGVYFLNCGIKDSSGNLLHRIIDALAFRVFSKELTYSTGIVNFCYEPKILLFDHKINHTVKGS